MEATMKKAVLVIATLMLFAMVNTSYAEERKWSIQIEPMWMDVKGNDVHVGDVFRERGEWNAITR
jgi:hypothetical protein